MQAMAKCRKSKLMGTVIPWTAGGSQLWDVRAQCTEHMSTGTISAKPKRSRVRLVPGLVG